MSISPYDRDLYRAFPELACEPGAVGDGFARWLGALPEQLAMIGLGVKGVSSNRPDILLDHLNKQKADA